MRIAIFDIETSAIEGWTWGLWKQNVLGIKRDWELLSFAFKELGKPGVTVYSRRTHTEQQLVAKLYKMYENYDFLVGHNGDDFDIPKIRAKFLEFGFLPPAPNKSIDTLKLARKYFQFSSNKLTDLCQKLSLGKKIETGGFDHWKKCMAGDVKAMLKMERYNKHDVVLTERLYKKLRPYILNQPGISLARTTGQCPHCQSTSYNKNGLQHAVGLNGVITRIRLKCKGCGGYFLMKGPK